MTNPKLQSLRIEAGWNIAYNQFTELDPSYLNKRNQEYSLLMICNAERGKMINLIWKSRENAEGEFKLLALNYLETFNPDTNNFDLEVDWGNPFAKFESKNRQEIIDKIEKWFVELPVTNDTRLLKKRGEVDEPSENYRKELLKNGINDVLIQNILSKGNQKIQDILLDHTKLYSELVSN